MPSSDTCRPKLSSTGPKSPENNSDAPPAAAAAPAAAAFPLLLAEAAADFNDDDDEEEDSAAAAAATTTPGGLLVAGWSPVSTCSCARRLFRSKVSCPSLRASERAEQAASGDQGSM